MSVIVHYRAIIQMRLNQESNSLTNSAHARRRYHELPFTPAAWERFIFISSELPKFAVAHKTPH